MFKGFAFETYETGLLGYDHVYPSPLFCTVNSIEQVEDFLQDQV